MKETNNQTIPSFSSLKRILSETSLNIAHITFTPILPYPATNYHAIYTVLVNFQDIRKQKQQVSGALWCDEGVYHIAKELQLLYSANFNDIFLRLGGFHMEKVVLHVIGQFLGNICSRDIFVQNEIYGPAVIDDKVTTGSHYVLSRQAFRILHEVVNRLRFAKFERQKQKEMHLPCLKPIQDIRNCFEQGEPDIIKNHWNTLREEKEFDTYQTEFSQFLIDGGKRSEKFKYWNLFLDVIMPVMTDQIFSFQQADWKASLSSMRKSISLFFAFGRINYCR